MTTETKNTSADVQLSIDNQNIQTEVFEGTTGRKGLKTALGPTDYFAFDPGFTTTMSCESKLTFIDGINGILTHGGYPIDQLATECSYMDVCYLLLHAKLPSPMEKENFITEIKLNSHLHAQITQFFHGFRRDAHPMAIMVGVVGALSAFYYHKPDSDEQEFQMLTAKQLIAKMPAIAAMSYKYSIGEPFVHPRKDLSYAENFLHMMFSKPNEDWHIDPILAKAMDRIFILHADHEQNASTTTVRVAGSTGANPFACISAGIGALWGPAHGGANEACLNMLQEIGSVDRIPEFIARAKDKSDPFRLMGFGHRVYKNYDPRAKVMHKTCHEVLDAVGKRDEPLFKLAMELERIALEDEYFIEKKLYPNVDFYSGLTLSAIGIPKNMFTVMFALARTVGWISHWIEMMNDKGSRLARPRQLYTGPTLRDVPPVDER